MKTSKVLGLVAFYKPRSEIISALFAFRSLKNPSKTYVGYTLNLKNRFTIHNSGGSVHTKSFRPWKLVTYIAFSSDEKAKAFEKYIKVGSGHAFAKRRLW